MATVEYRGWKIEEKPNNPVTGRFTATRFGVGMYAGTLQALKRMIDQKVDDNGNR